MSATSTSSALGGPRTGGLGVAVRLPVSVIFPEALDDVVCRGRTVREVLGDFCSRRPELAPRVWRSDGDLWVTIAVNGDELGGRQALAWPVADGDEVRLMPAVG